MRRWLAGLGLAALAALAQAGEGAVARPPADGGAAAEAAPTVIGRGLASWYGLPFHGRRTASGERFDMTEFTAAHPWLPFGTLVQVRSLVNGRRIVVRINDRGPHVPGRIIDLSHSAARALGLLTRGTKRVELSTVE